MNLVFLILNFPHRRYGFYLGEEKQIEVFPTLDFLSLCHILISHELWHHCWSQRLVCLPEFTQPKANRKCSHMTVMTCGPDFLWCHYQLYVRVRHGIICNMLIPWPHRFCIGLRQLIHTYRWASEVLMTLLSGHCIDNSNLLVADDFWKNPGSNFTASTWNQNWMLDCILTYVPTVNIQHKIRNWIHF